VLTALNLVDRTVTTVTLTDRKVGDVVVMDRLLIKASDVEGEPATVSVNDHLRGI
jgi:hypothetical protein